MAIKCISKNCPFSDTDHENCHFIDCCDFAVEQPTNADRIRNMRDEELAEVIACPKGLFARMDCFDDNRDCKHCALEWLQQPAEGE